jgi:hypothetical protein
MAQAGHRGRARPTHAARHGALQRGGGSSATRSMAHPPALLRLHAAKPTPQQRWRQRGSHQGSGGSAAALDVEVDKRLQTWTKAPGLGSLAAQARHER